MFYRLFIIRQLILSSSYCFSVSFLATIVLLSYFRNSIWFQIFPCLFSSSLHKFVQFIRFYFSQEIALTVLRWILRLYWSTLFNGVFNSNDFGTVFFQSSFSISFLHLCINRCSSFKCWYLFDFYCSWNKEFIPFFLHRKSNKISEWSCWRMAINAPFCPLNSQVFFVVAFDLFSSDECHLFTLKTLFLCTHLLII